MSDAIDAVVSRARDVLGPPAGWRNPEGYPDGLALCIIDAVWSLAAHYDHHVVPVLDRYRTLRRDAGGDPSRDGTAALVEAVASCGGVNGFALAMNNRQRTSTTSGVLKAEAVHRAATSFDALGIDSAADFRRRVAEQPSAVKAAWRATPGQRSSDIGWRYLLLLAGGDEVKPGRMIERFLRDCGVAPLTTVASSDLVKSAASRLGVPARVLDHTIWRYQRSAASIRQRG